LEAAVAADPTLASALNTLSRVLYLSHNRLDANLAALRAYEADAYLRDTDRLLSRLFNLSYDLENFSEAKRWCDEGGRRFPTDNAFVDCQLWLFTTRAVEPDVEQAWLLLDELVALTPEHNVQFVRSYGQMLVAAALARAGLADSARSVLVSSRADLEVDPDRALLTLEAFIRTLLGDTEEALRLLRAYMISNPHHRDEESEDVHWWWRSLQDDPRYQALLTETR
jgi:tetratricopeptide (TPR) repeat protein